MNNLLGQKLGRLTVVRDAGSDKHKNKIWDCICDCGSTTTVGGYLLSSGNTRSCGCLRNELTRARATKHGHKSGRTTTQEYNSWNGMIKRCTQTSSIAYHNYGGRGISVCERWLNSFENFLEDMGRKPSPTHSIDREDVNGNYTPENCFWATKNEQARNKRKLEKNKSGVVGIHWCKRDLRWVAQISVNNSKIRLGNFVDIEDAKAARRQAEIKYWNTQPS